MSEKAAETADFSAKPHVRLCVRAQTLLIDHYDALSEFDRSYLCEIHGRGIVWGTEFQQKRVANIEVAMRKELPPTK